MGKPLSALSLEEVQQRYKVPFFIWANYDIQEAYYDKQKDTSPILPLRCGQRQFTLYTTKKPFAVCSKPQKTFFSIACCALNYSPGTLMERKVLVELVVELFREVETLEERLDELYRSCEYENWF